MPISDKKKAQSLINHVGWEIIKMREGLIRINEYKTKYQDQNVDPTGTPLDGHEATLVAALVSLNVELQGPVFDALVAAIVPTHRGMALDPEV